MKTLNRWRRLILEAAAYRCGPRRHLRICPVCRAGLPHAAELERIT